MPVIKASESGRKVRTINIAGARSIEMQKNVNFEIHGCSITLLVKPAFSAIEMVVERRTTVLAIAMIKLPNRYIYKAII
jgi:hypothetical protein